MHFKSAFRTSILCISGVPLELPLRTKIHISCLLSVLPTCTASPNLERGAVGKAICCPIRNCKFDSPEKISFILFLSTGEAALVDSVGREFVFAYPTPYVPGFSNRPFLYGVRFYLPTIYLVITNPTSTDFTVDVNLITIRPPSTSLVRSQEVTNARPANISISVDEYFGSTSVSDYFGRDFSSVIDDLGFLNNFDPLKDPPPTIKVTSQGDITVHAYYSYNQRYSAWMERYGYCDITDNGTWNRPLYSFIRTVEYLLLTLLWIHCNCCIRRNNCVNKHHWRTSSYKNSTALWIISV